MAINKISNTTRGLIREQSVLSIPDRPTEKGFTAQQLKEYFTNLVLGDQGALTEIDRLVDEINELVGDIGDETIKNYVTNSIISKLIEQSPYIGLSIVNNKLRYTRFGNPNITGELDYIPSDSVFFNGDNLLSKNKSVILPKTSIDKLVDKIDDKSVREYILGLNSKINELLEKHNQEIESVNASLEAILGGDAPDALNSIKELAEALKNNPSQVDNLLLQLSNLENNKVDRIDGKQLSTNDYDNESKAFVDSLKTKNLIGEEDLKTDLSQFNDDSEHRLVSDEEKNNWNSKADGNHKHGIEDVNGLSDALNDKSHKDHTHTADEIGAEGKGTTEKLINDHNSSEKSHEDIRLILDLLRNRVDGIHSAISFYDEQQLIDWIDGVYTRNDGFIPDNLFVGQHIYIKNQDENDYWVAVTPVTSLSELLPLPTDKINLEDYAAIEDLKRVAFTGSYKDLSDVPNIPKSLSELSEDDNHKTITKQKLELIDTNAEKLLGKLDTNLGIDEANKMLITDAEGKITTAVAGSMSVLVDNLTSSSTTMPLTANQGRVLNNIKLDKQQGVENANKYLYVNDLGLIDLIEKGTGDDELANYLPLTAGIDKKLTGDLYFDNNKFIKGYTTASTLRNLIGVNTASVIELGDVSANINVKAASAFRPAKNNETALGTNALQWKEIYGTTIYQNGKQVATLDDIKNANVELPENITLFDENVDISGNIDPMSNYYKKSEIDTFLVEVDENLNNFYNKEESDSKFNEKLNKSGGQLTGPIILDQSGNSGIILGNNGKIGVVNTDGVWQTILQNANLMVQLGHKSIALRLIGNGTRPSYSNGTTNVDLALYTDLPIIKAGRGINLKEKDNIKTISLKDKKFQSTSTKTPIYRKKWITKTWEGLVPTFFDIWTDGENIYSTSFNSSYVLDVETSTWSSKSWSGSNSPKGEGKIIWTDGTNIYSSGITSDNTGTNLVYNKELEQWDVKEWIGLTSGKELWAKNIWTDGENIYYSTKGTTSSTTMSATTSQQLVLDIETSTWSTMTWNGINDFNGEDIWTDGDNIYLTLYDSGTKHYVLDKSTNTWVTKTWNGFADASPFVYGRYIWTNGEKIYYSDGTDQYVLDKETETWNKISWDGISSLYASSIWRIGDKIYNGSSYELIKHEIYC